MNSIPVEIFEQIFKLLHQKDKVECLTVCRAWKNALESTVLLQVVRLKSTEQLDKLVEKMGRDPGCRQRIERLIIEMSNITSKEIDSFPFLFENIQGITLFQDISGFDLRFIKLLSPHTWSKTIMRIREESGHFLTDLILKSGVCPTLTEIALHGKNQQIENEFISLLGNASKLKMLTLQNYALNLTDLESLHEKVPSITSLSLEMVTISSQTIPTEVEPANSVMKLSVQTTNYLPTGNYIALFNYLAKKYARITNFTYSIGMEANNNYEECVNLGIVPYIKQIAPYLTTFQMPDCESFQYIFPTLDQYNCHLKEVNLTEILDESGISKIVESNQAQSIEKLTINELSDDFFMIYLSKLTALTELHLCYTKTQPNPKIDVTVNSLLRSIESALTTLTLVETNMEFDSSSIQPCPTLKTLILRRSIIPQGIDLFIYQAFPNLRTLVMDHCSYKTSFFYFGHLNMSCIELRGEFTSENEHVLVVTVCNDERRFYTADKVSEWNEHPDGPLTDFPAIKYVPIDKFNGLPYVTFICKSLYSFIMVNTSA